MKADARTQKTLKTQRAMEDCAPATRSRGNPNPASASSMSSESSVSSPFPQPPCSRLALSALQHLLYCPRQCALIHIERLWSENWHTAQGRLMHDRTDTPETVTEYGMKVTRAMKVWSDCLGLYGVCDVVEWREGIPTPVEYKRGKPKQHQADEVQLCAQAMCLEEMFDVRIAQADLFYGKTRRRVTVNLDCGLHKLTRDLAARLHELIQSGLTPPAAYNRKKCCACSLLEQCMPQAGSKGSVAKYLEAELN